MKVRLLRLLGYMSAADALAGGYTHHGSYFGLPLWLGDVDNQWGLQVAAKWAPLDFLVVPCSYIEEALAAVFLPGREPGFRFWVGPPIQSAP